jgi:hypothetical protein
MYDYVEHPSEIPVEASLLPECLEPKQNDPFWGLKIPSTHPMQPNSKVELRFALGNRTIGAVGQVVRCIPHSEGYVVWVRFASFVECHKARLGEQACQMESWIRTQEKMGVHVEREQAEQEWLARYAANFPAIALSEAA